MVRCYLFFHIIIEQLKKIRPDLELYAIGTNGIATSAMLKAGADYGATGENPAIATSGNVFYRYIILEVLFNKRKGLFQIKIT